MQLTKLGTTSSTETSAGERLLQAGVRNVGAVTRLLIGQCPAYLKL